MSNNKVTDVGNIKINPSLCNPICMTIVIAKNFCNDSPANYRNNLFQRDLFVSILGKHN